MLLTVRAVALLMTGGHSVGRLPPAAMAFGRGYLLGVPNLLWLAALVYVGGRHPAARAACSGASCSWSAPIAGRRHSAACGSRAPGSSPSCCPAPSPAVAGIAVVLRLGSGGPILGDNLLLMAIAAVVLGGTSIMGGDGGVFRTATGAAVIVLLDKGLNLLGLEFYDQAIVIGAVILIGSALGVRLHRRRTQSTS